MIHAFKYEHVVQEVPRLKRGRVWCATCGFTMSVNATQCLAHGWPKCCGQTMTIDSPHERDAAKGA